MIFDIVGEVGDFKRKFLIEAALINYKVYNVNDPNRILTPKIVGCDL